MAKFSKIHAVCEYLRNYSGGAHKPCEQCPAWESGPYGKTQRMCRGIAEEVIRIAKTGSPYRNARRSVVREWRRRFNMSGGVGKDD